MFMGKGSWEVDEKAPRDGVIHRHTSLMPNKHMVLQIGPRAEITRFLRHPSTSSGQALQLWRDADDIQAVHGPPDLLEPPDEPGGDQWDGVDDLQPLDWVA